MIVVAVVVPTIVVPGMESVSQSRSTVGSPVELELIKDVVFEDEVLEDDVILEVEDDDVVLEVDEFEAVVVPELSLLVEELELEELEVVVPELSLLVEELVCDVVVIEGVTSRAAGRSELVDVVAVVDVVDEFEYRR